MPVAAWAAAGRASEKRGVRRASLRVIYGISRHPCAYAQGVLGVFANSLSSDEPLSGLAVADRPEPSVPDGWEVVSVRAASLNHHDLWSLRGVGLSVDALPMILGC